jgi:hypothetical protein
MSKRNATRVVVLALAATSVLIGSALPAAASVSPYNVKYHSGRISITRFGITTNFDTPGTSVAGCPGSTTITGAVDDAGGTDTITGTLSISSPFTFGTGTFILTLTGTATSTNSGNYSGGATGTFNNLAFTGSSYTIKTLNPTTCVAGTQICGAPGAGAGTTPGTLNLTASGGVAVGSTVPLNGNSTTNEFDGEKIYVNATGSFTNAGCITGSVFALIIATGATIGLVDNPSDCYLVTCAVDPGAIFTQQP